MVPGRSEPLNTAPTDRPFGRMSDQEGESDPCCKVGEVAETHGLADLDTTLRERWTDTVDRSSVRDLADFVNTAVLRSALRAHRGTVAGEPENYYRLLTDDDVSRGMRTEARERLRRFGVDVDALEDEFVSHQTVYRHLRNCLGVDRGAPPPDAETAVRDALGTVRALQRRTEVVTTTTLERLDRDGHIDIGEPDVLVDVAVTCRGCGERIRLSDSLAGRSCGCHR